MRRLKEGMEILMAALSAAFLLFGPCMYASGSDRKLNINAMGRSELEELRLLTPFQIESLLEYRALWGDILSAAELSLVDGFADDDVAALSAVVTFDLAPSSSGRAKQSASVRYRKPYDKKGFALTTKYELASERFGCGIVIDNDPGEKFPDFFSAYAQYGGALVGDFKACFGQGLVLWKGMNFNSLGEPSAIVKKESGIQGYKSSDEENNLRGIAYSGRWGNFSASAFAAVDNRIAGANASLNYGTWKVGATAVSGMSKDRRVWSNGSVDFYGSIGGVRLFGEFATNEKFSPAFRMGALWRPLYVLEVGAAAWVYAPAYKAPEAVPSIKDQTGMELSARYSPGRWKFNANLAYRYKFSTAGSSWKYRASIQYTFENGSSVLYHYRNGQHRLDGRLSYGNWRFEVRAEGNLKGYGLFAEATYKRPGFEVTGRFTWYDTDGWDSRIYFYERDVPQSFSTVAYYNKGAGAYLVVRYTPVRFLDLWLKAQQNYLACFMRITIPG